MEKKKEKIVSISEELQIESIFSDEVIRKQVRDSVYPKIGEVLPNFDLTDEEIKLYYAEGSQVKVSVEKGGYFLGDIENVNFPKNILSIRNRSSNEVTDVSIVKVMRLL